MREEVNKALELGKPIFPMLYLPGQWTGEFDSLVAVTLLITFGILLSSVGLQ